MKKILFISLVLAISTAAFATITIERQRIATQADDINNAQAEGLITKETADKLRSDLADIQAKDLANTSDSDLTNKEVNRDLDQTQLEIKSAIAYGK